MTAERWATIGSDPPDSGFTHFEQVSPKIQVQNDHTCIPAASHMTKRLVHVCQTERRGFPHSHLSSAETVPQVCYPGDLLRISRPSLIASL